MFMKDEEEDKTPYVKAIMQKTNLMTVGELLEKPLEYLKVQAEKFSPGITEATIGITKNKPGMNYWDEISKSWKIASCPDPNCHDV